MLFLFHCEFRESELLSKFYLLIYHTMYNGLKNFSLYVTIRPTSLLPIQFSMLFLFVLSLNRGFCPLLNLKLLTCESIVNVIFICTVVVTIYHTGVNLVSFQSRGHNLIKWRQNTTEFGGDRLRCLIIGSRVVSDFLS